MTPQNDLNPLRLYNFTSTHSVGINTELNHMMKFDPKTTLFTTTVYVEFVFKANTQPIGWHQEFVMLRDQS
jgi:hypothetical protein